MNEPRILLDDVLDTIMREVKEPDFGALQRWSARFPQFTDELTDFFAAWTMQNHEEDDVAVDAEGLANRLVSHALGTLHAKRAASAGDEIAKGETRLLAYAQSLGLSAPDLAARARLDEDLVVKLDLRRLTNVPNLCLVMLYAAMGSVKDSLKLMVTGPPLLAAGGSYKSKTRPKPVTEDFLVAVARSALSDERKAFWETVVRSEMPGAKLHERMD